MVLSRKQNEEIRIGREICVKVLRIAAGRVKLGLQAPQRFRILRPEAKRKRAA